MPNPKWYDDLSAPFNEEYPTWESLPSLTMAQIKEEFGKYGIDYPYSLTYKPADASRGTPISGFKVPPISQVNRLMDKWPQYRLPWAGSTGIAYCMKMAYIGLWTFRMWCAQCSIFHSTGYIPGNYAHSRNILIAIGFDGLIHVYYFDLTTGTYAPIQFVSSVSECWPNGHMWTRPF